ncbi:bacteriophage abortive infection AbiH family protein [Mucilaginibacter sp. RCC_168]|uniref:bacteriophage abortive infection AbiH family protein n=1 Tax=Mucilaginibacter sp. RCC_168 TaxID=3239221 RepID=UPI003523D801
MSKRVLHIIGNGFDLFHGIRSAYWNFKEFVERNNKPLFENLEKYFDSDSLWSDFEATLADLDTETMVDEAMIYLPSYGADDWSDSGHHDYQYELQNRIDIVTKDLKTEFTCWILQLEIPQTAFDNRLGIKTHELFLNFNYTNSLERIYHVDPSDIKYIHNKAIDTTSVLILGHSRKPQGKSFNDNEDLESIDPRIYEGNQILDDYFIETYKPTAQIIAENEAFFEDLKDIEEIHVLGHSISIVDYSYFIRVLEKTDSNKVKWKISYYSDRDMANYQTAISEIGISPANTELIQISEFYTNQPKLF